MNPESNNLFSRSLVQDYYEIVSGDRFFCIEMPGFQDRWSAMGVVSQERSRYMLWYSNIWVTKKLALRFNSKFKLWIKTLD